MDRASALLESEAALVMADEAVALAMDALAEGRRHCGELCTEAGRWVSPAAPCRAPHVVCAPGDSWSPVGRRAGGAPSPNPLEVPLLQGADSPRRPRTMSPRPGWNGMSSHTLSAAAGPPQATPPQATPRPAEPPRQVPDRFPAPGAGKEWAAPWPTHSSASPSRHAAPSQAVAAPAPPAERVAAAQAPLETMLWEAYAAGSRAGANVAAAPQEASPPLRVFTHGQDVGGSEASDVESDASSVLDEGGLQMALLKRVVVAQGEELRSVERARREQLGAGYPPSPVHCGGLEGTAPGRILPALECYVRKPNPRAGVTPWVYKKACITYTHPHARIAYTDEVLPDEVFVPTRFEPYTEGRVTGEHGSGFRVAGSDTSWICLTLAEEELSAWLQ